MGDRLLALGVAVEFAVALPEYVGDERRGGKGLDGGEEVVGEPFRPRRRIAARLRRRPRIEVFVEAGKHGTEDGGEKEIGSGLRPGDAVPSAGGRAGRREERDR